MMAWKRWEDEGVIDDIDLITEFLAGVKFQKQFCDHHFLNVLEREGSGFFALQNHVWGGRES